jgi:hypothetical protein
MRWFVLFVILLSAGVLAEDVALLSDLVDVEGETAEVYQIVETQTNYELVVAFGLIFLVIIFWWMYHKVLEKWFMNKFN